MSDDELTFASVGPSGIVHYARCWPCMFGAHYPTPTWHTWAYDDDIAHAKATGQPDPSNKRCGCPCVDDAVFCEDNAFDVEDDETDVVSLNSDPCPICNATDACGYDADGRPLIHALNDEDDS